MATFPLFSPPHFRPEIHRPITEIRFSRWNNANAQKFITREHNQKELDDRNRIEKRFDAAQTISHNYNPAPPHLTNFRSTGTPSSPSAPSIRGKTSKYSKPAKSPSRNNRHHHPAFKPVLEPPKKIPLNEDDLQTPVAGVSFRIDDNGISYETPDAPFLYQYSYTETPKVKPLKLREPLVSPFGPTTMAKPWLGRKPLPSSKKKLPEFDSFQLPPPHKKGVKPVQSPGPFLPGSGPKYVRSREEVLGEPLTKEEIEDLIKGSKKSSRQLNIGRDGLTHNMLDNIHALWKRRRVCKIKCKGVCTVDMESVCQQLEEKTGGKIIYNRGGIIYLFRGRNYNYKSRPRYPLMLWKPVSPVYPRLIKRIPIGLTLEEASEMRKKGHNLTPICKLAKNGVYCDLVNNVREAFECCELARINCQGLNPSDYKKIGAKLKDLVPCVLLSFEFEHILMWRGPDWKSSLVEPNESPKRLHEVETNVEGQLASQPLNGQSSSVVDDLERNLLLDSSNEELQGNHELVQVGVDPTESHDISVLASGAVPNDESDGTCGFPSPSINHSEAANQTVQREMVKGSGLEEAQIRSGNTESSTNVQLSNIINDNEVVKLSVPSPSAEKILLLRKQAVESGIALVLDGCSLDADRVFKETVAFAKVSPSGPVFGRRPRKVTVEGKKEREDDCLDDDSKEGGTDDLLAEISRKREERKKSPRAEKLEDVKADYLNVIPQGNLRVDELAKLLS